MGLIVTSLVAPLTPSYFSILSHKRCNFWEKLTEHKMRVFIFSTTFLKNIFHSKKNLAIYRQKYRNVFMQSTRYCYQILMKVEFSRHIFGKSSSKSVHREPSSPMRTYGQTDGRTDIHDAANSRFSQLCDRALKALNEDPWGEKLFGKKKHNIKTYLIQRRFIYVHWIIYTSRRSSSGLLSMWQQNCMF
jgi:hypothetical protein